MPQTPVCGYARAPFADVVFFGMRMNLAGTAEFTDKATAYVPQRFYRVLVP